MSNYKIPSSRRPGLQILLKLSHEDNIRLQGVLADLPKGLRSEDLSTHLAEKKVFTEADSFEVVTVLSDLYKIIEIGKADLEELVEGICKALADQGDEDIQPKDGDWNTFKEHLRNLLSHDSTLGITFKAFYLAYQGEKNYIESNIFSDIRPAFNIDLEKGFDTAVIIHNLIIEYHTGATHEEIQIALDSEDILKLKEQLERAEKKDKAIRNQFKEDIDFIINPN